MNPRLVPGSLSYCEQVVLVAKVMTEANGPVDQYYVIKPHPLICGQFSNGEVHWFSPLWDLTLGKPSLGTFGSILLD